MNKYIAPELSLVKFLAQDIICTSAEETTDGKGDETPEESSRPNESPIL